MTLEWSLYDDFSQSYGRFRVFDLRNPPKSPFWSRNINFTWHIVETKLSVMKLRVRVYLNHHCTTIFHGDMAVTRHRVIAVFVFLTSEIPILEQKYKFHLTHCRNKVVRYEITSPCIFESSLYDDFPRRYGRNGSSHFANDTNITKCMYRTANIGVIRWCFNRHVDEDDTLFTLVRAFPWLVSIS